MIQLFTKGINEHGKLFVPVYFSFMEKLDGCSICKVASGSKRMWAKIMSVCMRADVSAFNNWCCCRHPDYGNMYALRAQIWFQAFWLIHKCERYHKPAYVARSFSIPLVLHPPVFLFLRATHLHLVVHGNACVSLHFFSLCVSAFAYDYKFIWWAYIKFCGKYKYLYLSSFLLVSFKAAHAHALKHMKLVRNTKTRTSCNE